MAINLSLFIFSCNLGGSLLFASPGLGHSCGLSLVVSILWLFWWGKTLVYFCFHSLLTVPGAEGGGGGWWNLSSPSWWVLFPSKYFSESGVPLLHLVILHFSLVSCPYLSHHFFLARSRVDSHPFLLFSVSFHLITIWWPFKGLFWFWGRRSSRGDHSSGVTRFFVNNFAEVGYSRLLFY